MDDMNLRPITNELVCLAKGFLTSIFVFLTLGLSFLFQLFSELFLDPTLNNASLALSWLRQLPMKQREIHASIVRSVDVNILERYLTKVNFIGSACFLQFLNVENSDRLVVPFTTLTL